MRTFFVSLVGIGFLLMSTQNDALAGETMLLETSQGQVEITMLSDMAPKHVARITDLVNDGFYDGIIFHRVIPGFMAQTCDPTGTGMGGSGENLDA